ncbi:MAG: ZIP family metal transporter [Pirellulales bacterium]
MHPVFLLSLYCLACVACSLLGGWIPLIFHLTHRRMQIAISFVSGVVLGIGLLHLVPHSLAITRSIDATVLWAMAGFLFMFFLERFFHFHHHDVPEDPLSLEQVIAKAEDHDHHQGHDHRHTVKPSHFSWSGAAIGLTLHGLIDGLAMAAAVKAEEAHGLVALAGIGTALAVILHKPFDSLTIATLMAAADRPVRSRHLFNTLYALVTPLGAALFYVASARFAGTADGLGQVLGFAAGAFICIASSDLLPELQFHGHDRGKLSLALVAGIALAWATVFLEGGHDHEHAHDEHDHHGHDLSETAEPEHDHADHQHGEAGHVDEQK